ncbi:MAG: DUF58 domain-containing protein, partial [Planctomycetota bacterium]
MAGGYSSVFRGSGIEFDEVREFAEGDDLRSVDWNVTARQGRPFVKKFVEERELSVLFLLDVSSSMGFGTAPPGCCTSSIPRPAPRCTSTPPARACARRCRPTGGPSGSGCWRPAGAPASTCSTCRPKARSPIRWCASSACAKCAERGDERRWQSSHSARRRPRRRQPPPPRAAAGHRADAAAPAR